MPAVSPLTNEELETGLRLLGRRDIDQNAFWDENIVAFRQTVLLAIRETSDALLSPRVTLRWRAEFEAQLLALAQYIELADRYIAERSCEPGLRSRIH
jgi:hypothetical protein